MVAQNHFYDVSPNDTRDGDHLGFPFVQGILQLSNDQLRMTLDLGWYPDGDPSGSYRLLLIQWDPAPQHDNMPKNLIATKRNGIEYTYALRPLLVGDAWSHPLIDFSSKDAREIVDQINDILANVALGQIGSH